MNEELTKYGGNVAMTLSIPDEELKEWRMKLQQFIKIAEKKPSKTKPHKQGFQYVPIDVLENKLNELFFGLWNWTITGEPKVVANEIIVCGILEVFHPTALTWLKRSGIGAAQIRFKQDSDIMNLGDKIKTALQMDAPHAEAEAFKNACAKFGRIFGRGLRREMDAKEEFTPLIKQSAETEKIIEDFQIILDGYENPEELLKNKDIILKRAKEKNVSSVVSQMIQTKYNELNK